MTDLAHEPLPQPFGQPHIHLPEVASTSDIAKSLAQQGASHGTLVSTDLQRSGRGRQGRNWSTAQGALVLSLVLRERLDRLVPLRAGLAVAQLAGRGARVKWPNDVLVDGRKVAGILVEEEGDALILGIGVNAAVDLADLPREIAARAGTLGYDLTDRPRLQSELLVLLERALALSSAEVIAALGARDALVGQAVRWEGGEGTAIGIAENGCLRVRVADGSEQQLDGGEIHLL